MEIVSFQSGQVSPGIKYYTVDTEADKNTIPIGKMGNRCYVIESKKWYILNSNGEWVPFAAEGGAVDTDAILSAVENMTDAQRSQFISDLGFGTVFTFMGSVASQSDLPNSNNKVGYVYYVELDSSEYVWVVNQSQPNGYWEELGKTFVITIDSKLSTTSENPVQNKVIALALNELHGSMDALVEMLDESKQDKSTVVTISGATPTITPEDNTVYHCGELASLTINNPPATGSYSIVFTSGATATTTTFPATILGLESFAAEANTLYEINVLDNRAVVGSWEVSA